jgi:hypothetical protein
MTDNNNTGFGINDLRLMLNFIDVVSARGAVKPNEMSAVGELHTKLTVFLATVDKQVTPPTQESGSSIATNGQGE